MSGSESLRPPCWPSGPFRCIVADPPWKMQLPHWRRDKRPGRNPRPPETLFTPYPTMTVAEIKAMPVEATAQADAHLWLWVTNQFLPAGLEIMQAWGFKYHTTITWTKPSGCGIWFVQRTQHILFGWRGRFGMQARCRPNLIEGGNPERHSAKPEESYALIEAVSPGPRLELFARRQREGWTCWGNEVEANAEVSDGER